MKEIEFKLESHGFYSVVLPEFDRVVGKFLPLCDGSFAVIDKDNEMTIVHSKHEVLKFLFGEFSDSNCDQFEEEWKRVIDPPKEPDFINSIKAIVEYCILCEARLFAEMIGRKILGQK